VRNLLADLGVTSGTGTGMYQYGEGFLFMLDIEFGKIWSLFDVESSLQNILS
jgi:hypothetical protein